ncbi:demethylmenaquinone methyltransferase [Sciscionella sediminilitoris]|uniref:demethylmenaquinone methyltransferase n=1 Tax=Sciscionella sediminilitoris TaxID=1445613 RepID=UPI0004DF3D70|nr:demethylmenaquinone methyltransferase [Sciscionella sp. SE31]
MSRASLDKEPHEVAAMFDEVAPRYDRMNTIMALGLDKRWRSATRKAIQSKHGERVLDLAAGTAVSTMEYARSGAWCLAADFSLGMLRSGARRPVPKVAADALALPFADDSFDVVTVSFGLRNFTDTAAAAREMLRVTKPGGRVVICEFSTPPFAPIRWAYFGIALRLIPVIARMASSNPAAYTYLPESIRAWPRQRELARIFAEAGWSELEWRNLTFGVVALHRAVKPKA